MEVSNFATLNLRPRPNPQVFARNSTESVMLDGKGSNSYINSLPISRSPSPRSLSFRRASRSSTSCRVTREESSGGGGGALSSGESILRNEQTLEQQLEIAIQEENYPKAAEIRDTLKLLHEDTKSSVLAANAKFYNSFRTGDLASMQSLWSKNDKVCVVHPGVSGITGYDLVMGSWEFVWADYEFPLDIQTKDVDVSVRGDMGYVTCIEMVKTKGGSNWGRHFATNVFEKIDGRWFMCIHHASYVDL
ncbi:hypothetical protein M569_16798 [Genlisea aurea]|uniref:SnoaL-like domain-containing protein n=1 Tax=Genlisea aurea TaxID=192259 RepID=S8BUG2_9LAMI|nr:hypothetical protein M569_16798 [Genlisea aurea]